METRSPESEIIIKITPRNLERLIYILMIIGLLIFSIVEFNIKTPDCPAINCTKTSETTKTETQVKEVTKPVEKEETKTATTGSGTVDFILQDVKTCETNTTDTGQFKSVSIYIKNGLDRQLKARLDVYGPWDSSDDEAVQQYAIKKIEDIAILPGNTLTHTYPLTGGMFKRVAKEKTVKVVLVDTDLSKTLGEQSKTGVLASGKCE